MNKLVHVRLNNQCSYEFNQIAFLQGIQDHDQVLVPFLSLTLWPLIAKAFKGRLIFEVASMNYVNH